MSSAGREKPAGRRARRAALRRARRAQAVYDKGHGRVPSELQERLRGAIERLSAVAEDPAAGAADLSGQRRSLEALEQEARRAQRSPLGLALTLSLALLVAVLLRLFVFEVFRIPSSSMRPSLVVGDHILLNQLSYGLPLPFSQQWLARWATPEPGQLVVFRYPKDPSRDFVKRVIATEGDRVRVRGCAVWVNGHRLGHSQAERARYRAEDEDQPAEERWVDRVKLSESLPDGEVHPIFCPRGPPEELRFGARPLPGLRCAGRRRGCVVEPGYVFVLGDNRSSSSDSRSWGAVPVELVRGEVALILWSWGPKTGPHWSRFGRHDF